MADNLNTYSNRNLLTISELQPRINFVAATLGIPNTAVAGAIAEELNDAELRTWEPVALIARNAWLLSASHDSIVASFADFETAAELDPSLRTIPPEGFFNKVDFKWSFPTQTDFGFGKIRLHNAIEMLGFYNSLYPDGEDPLGLKQYNGDFAALARDLEWDSDVNAAFAGLTIREAHDFFQSTAAGFYSLQSSQDRDALLITYYNRGRQNSVDAYEDAVDRGVLYQPGIGSGGTSHLFGGNYLSIEEALMRGPASIGNPLNPMEMFAPCFAAGTPILLSDGTSVAIEDVTAGMRVAAFDECDAAGTGALTSGLVTRLIPGITSEWIVLDDASSARLRGATRVTPHHRYLRPDGSFTAIAEPRGASFGPGLLGAGARDRASASERVNRPPNQDAGAIDAASNENAGAFQMRVAGAGGV